MSDAIPNLSEEWRRYVIDPAFEWHPDPRAYGRIADYILRIVNTS
jgi:hypothetical protein